MKVAARIGEGLRREIERGRRPTNQGLGWATASTTLLSLKSLCGGGVPSSHPSLGMSVFFLCLFKGVEWRGLAPCERAGRGARCASVRSILQMVRSSPQSRTGSHSHQGGEVWLRDPEKARACSSLRRGRRMWRCLLSPAPPVQLLLSPSLCVCRASA